nr:MAG TPA: hypothetical protein [Caudoviricetes sp.]
MHFTKCHCCFLSCTTSDPVIYSIYGRVVLL